MVAMQGAFVARIGTHCVAICNGLVFDNDPDWGFAIDARAAGDDVGALFKAIKLGGGIDEGRCVVLNPGVSNLRGRQR